MTRLDCGPIITADSPALLNRPFQDRQPTIRRAEEHKAHAAKMNINARLGTRWIAGGAPEQQPCLAYRILPDLEVARGPAQFIQNVSFVSRLPPGSLWDRGDIAFSIVERAWTTQHADFEEALGEQRVGQHQDLRVLVQAAS